MEDVKIYGLCLERLKYQIGLAKEKSNNGESLTNERYLMESYHTSDIDDIIDILELYDLEGNTSSHLKEKLDELAYTVSLLIGEKITFGLTDEGFLGLYLLAHDEALMEFEEAKVSVR